MFCLDAERIVIGTEEGLYCIDLDREGMPKNSPSSCNYH